MELFSRALRAVFVIDLPSGTMREGETREVEGHSIPENYPTPPFRKGKIKTAVSGGMIERLDVYFKKYVWPLLFVINLLESPEIIEQA